MITNIEDTKKSALKDLAQQAISKKLILFVGAGVSKAAGLPSWAEMLQQIQKKHDVKTLISDPIKLASFLEKKLSPAQFRREICDLLRTAPANDIPIVNALLDLPSSLIVTTNYDHLIENHLIKRGVTPKIIMDSSALSQIDFSGQEVVKLHGDINSPKSLVITEKDYRNYPKDRSGLNDFFSAYQFTNTVLFVGASFEDPRLKNADDWVLDRLGEYRNPPYIFVKLPNQEEPTYGDVVFFISELEERGIKIIPILDYSEITIFLRELSAYIRKERKPLSISPLLIEALDKSIQDKIDRLLSALNEDQFKKSVENLEKLLGSDELTSSPLQKFKGWVTIADHTIQKDEPDRANDFLKKACSILNELKTDTTIPKKEIVEAEEQWEIVKAKQEFVEDANNDHAIERLKKYTTNKAINFRAVLMLEVDRTKDAEELLAKSEITPELAIDFF